MENDNIFDNLVTSISQGERIEILKHLQETSSSDAQCLISDAQRSDEQVDLKEKLTQESFLTRLWLHIKALFSSNDIENVYNRYLLTDIAKSVEKDYPDLIDFKHNNLLTLFYTKLRELKGVAEFFKPMIIVYEENPCSFYILLSSLIIPEIHEQIDNEVSPYSLPFEREVTNELRTSLLRKMDEIIQKIPSEQKNKFYACIKAVEWLKSFTKLPFDRFLTRFVTLLTGSFTCPIDSASYDLGIVSKVLTNGVQLHTEVFEALYLLNQQNLIELKAKQEDFDEQQSDSETVNQSTAIEQFMNKALDQVSLIKMFITTIPLKKITSIANNSSIWQAEKLDGVEDWFVKYKSYWKKIFDQKWSLWLKDRRKALVEIRVLDLFKTDDYPRIPNRPWLEIWGGIDFSYEYSVGFLFAFFEQLYPNYNKTLKTLMIEGEFSNRENRVEYTDTYNLLNHLSQSMVEFNEKLSSKGIYGSSFANIIKESIRTIQGQNRINNLMNTIESEANSLLSQFSEATRSLQLILGGILLESKDSRYGVLSNMASVQGSNNSIFRINLQTVRHSFIECLDLLLEIEAVEMLEKK